MNKWQAEVQKSLLESEEAAIKALEKQYKSALNEILQKVKLFEADIQMLDEALNTEGLDEAAKAALQSQKRSKVYQKQFQEALYGQISGILERMQGNNYSTIESYLKGCYEDAYVGTLYDLSNQGIPVITPIDQAAVTQAILTDSKVSKGLYGALGIDIGNLKKNIAQEVSRGIASALPYSQIARNIVNTTKAPLSRAKTITRTEGHRVQQKSSDDAAFEAKAKGADLVKVWDSVLDGRTRPSHRKIDGEIKELEEAFSNGMKYPGDPVGRASEVVNCRCVKVHKPRWDVDGGFAKMDNFTGEVMVFESAKDYAEFKERYWSKENVDYMKYVDTLEKRHGTKNFNTIAAKMTDREWEHFKKLEIANPMLKTTQTKVNSDALEEGYFEIAKEKLQHMTPQKSSANWASVLGVNEDTSNALNELHSDLNQHMIQTHTEKAALFALEGNEVLISAVGNINTVNVSDFGKILKNSPANSIIFAHVHPDDGSFSQEDIEHLVYNKSVKALSLELADGNKYILERGSFKTGIFGNVKYEKAFDAATIEAQSHFEIFKNDQTEDLPEELHEEFYSIWNDYVDMRNRIFAEKIGMTYKKVENNGQ